MPVRIAREGDSPAVGTVLLAGTSDHLVLKSANRLGYTPEPRDNVHRPSVDVFFHSVSRLWQGEAVGVLLTGMGSDGAQGLKGAAQPGASHDRAGPGDQRGRTACPRRRPRWTPPSTSCRWKESLRDWSSWSQQASAFGRRRPRLTSNGCGARILKQHGIEPAPERQRRTTWQEFLRRHRGVLAAADFFSVEVWTAGGLTRFAVLFVIDLATRRVEIAGIVREPDSAWVVQCGRQLTDPDEGCLRGKRFLLHDRDPRFTEAFADTLAAAGVETVRLPPRSPNLNAYAERFVRTIKESCLDQLILVGERSLRNAVHEFVEHYHHERNHQGMSNRLLFPVERTARGDGPIACRARLGGLLKYYDRPAA